MFKCNVKKILARRVFKIFSGMRTFLVERFTALTFWLLFSQLKSDIKEFLISNVIKKELEKSDDLESKCNSTLNYWNKKVGVSE